MALAREGYKVTAVTEQQLAAPDDLLAGLGRETLCFVLSLEDPVLGLKSNSETLLEGLREKKIFTLLISHSTHFYEPPPVEVLRTEARLHGLEAGLTLGFLGARFKFAPFLAEGLPWESLDIESVKSRYGSALLNDQVEALESSQILGCETPFRERARLKDRALLFWRDLDGHAVIELLSEKLGIALPSVRQGGALETLSLSRWGGVLTMKWAEKAFALNPLQVRGSVIVHQDLLSQHADLKDRLEEVVKEIYQMQGQSAHI